VASVGLLFGLQETTVSSLTLRGRVLVRALRVFMAFVKKLLQKLAILNSAFYFADPFIQNPIV